MFYSNNLLLPDYIFQGEWTVSTIFKTTTVFTKYLQFINIYKMYTVTAGIWLHVKNSSNE